ncbi:MAG: DUF4091 domain-containing protein [Planctomycetes bacterium]|nr:DUF4091 domain-containing protein [Planctomycetota bacterium]
MKQVGYIALIFMLAASCARGQGAASDELSIISTPRVAKAPAIDGEFEDQAWAGAGRAPFVSAAVGPAGYFMMCYDERAIYLALHRDEPLMNTLRASHKNHDGEIWNEDNFQIFISPRHGHRNYFQFMVSAINTRWDAIIEDYFSNINVTYNPQWTSAVKRLDAGWRAEIAIPFDQLGATPADGDAWGLNVCYTRANETMPVHYGASWSALITGANFHLADRFGLVKFAGAGPVAKVTAVPCEAGRRQEFRFEVVGDGEFGIEYAVGPRGDLARQQGRHKAQGNSPDACAITPSAADNNMLVNVKDNLGSVIYSTGRLMLSTPAQMRDGQKLLSQLLANGPADEGKKKYGIGVISSMTKVLPRRAELVNELPARDIVLGCARNETEAAQILLYSPDADLKDVQLELTDLACGEAVIESSNLWAAAVGFVNVKPQNNYPVNFTGWTSDPILTYLETFDAKAGDIQPVWVSLRAPAGTKPGTYTGSITIRPANAPASRVGISLEVWDFELPATPSLPTAVGQITGAREVYAHQKPTPQRLAQLDDAIDRFHVSHRIAPPDIYRPWPITKVEVERWKSLPVNAFNIVYIGDRQLKKDSEEFKPGLDEQIAAAMKLVAEAGLEKRAYFYAFDELHKSRHAMAARVMDRLKKQYPAVKILTTILENGYDIDGALGAVDAFCPLVSFYDAPRARQARQRGKEVWWYVCCGPPMPYPNLMLEHPLIESRMLSGFMSFAFQVDGFLYYRMSSRDNNGKDISGGPYVDWDTFSYKTYNGDGHIWYPGADGPVTSVRMENLQDGLEDYEYLVLARAAVGELRAAGRTEEADRLDEMCAALGAPGNELVMTTTDFSRSPAELLEVRRRLANVIVQCQDYLK